MWVSVLCRPVYVYYMNVHVCPYICAHNALVSTLYTVLEDTVSVELHCINEIYYYYYYYYPQFFF